MNLFAIEILGYVVRLDAGRPPKPATDTAPARKNPEQIRAEAAVTSTTTGGVMGFAIPTRDVAPPHVRWEPGHWVDEA